MKTRILIFSAMTLAAIGCRSTSDSLEPRTTTEHRYRHSEPYSKEQRENVDEPAGAKSQSREGYENPFIQPKAGETQQVPPAETPAPPRRD